MSKRVFPEHPEAEIPADVKGLIFDMDGTLIDTMPIHYKAWCMALEGTGLEMSEEKFYSMAGVATKKIMERLCREQGKQHDPGMLAHRKEEIYLKMMPHALLIPEVIGIARREKGKRKLAVASGAWRRIVEQCLRFHHCLTLFDAIVGTDDVEHGKPHPDIFLKAAERLGVKPEECIVYEDGEPGFQAAKAAGMRLIDVRPWYMPRKTAEGEPPMHQGTKG